jgi:hypothetical protein
MKKISISISNEVLEWVLREKGDLKVSTFINGVLRDRMQTGGGYSCNVYGEFETVSRRLKRLEDEVHQLLEVRQLNAGKLGGGEHISIMSTRPKDVFGRLVNIKNVSAKNAMAVYGELIPFMREKSFIDREIVLRELFPRTCSSITNDINYWYNACRGILDHLTEEGYVIRLEKGKYKWIGNMDPRGS